MAAKTKENVLELLKSKPNEAVSGEYMASSLSISRSAVWKAIKELQKDGYQIDAATNRGYSLINGNAVISKQSLLKFLPPDIPPAGIHIFDTLQSTAITSKEMALANAAHGTVVIAKTQTAGRGRYGRKFFSDKNSGLYISFILKPGKTGFVPMDLITIFAAVCVCRAIESVCGKHPGIKWINDVFYRGKKICGILTEAVMDLESRNTEWVTLGIGINIKEPDGGFPPEIKDTAAALYAAGETPADINRLAAALIALILAPGSFAGEEDILNEYRKRLIMLGKKITVICAGGDYPAMALTVDEKGRLLVKKESGETESLFSGEISIKTRDGNGGFTLVECVMAIIILSIIALTAFGIFSFSAKADLNTETVYESGILLESVMAESRLTDRNVLKNFSPGKINDIEELFSGRSYLDYGVSLSFRDILTGEELVFASAEALGPAMPDFSVEYEGLSGPGSGLPESPLLICAAVYSKDLTLINSAVIID